MMGDLLAAWPLAVALLVIGAVLLGILWLGWWIVRGR
jgi:hypothetical protein